MLVLNNTELKIAVCPFSTSINSLREEKVFVETFPILDRILNNAMLCRFSAGGHSCSEFVSAVPIHVQKTAFHGTTSRPSTHILICPIFCYAPCL